MRSGMHSETGHRQGDVDATDLEVWRLLPWLANDTLEGAELERVLRHLEHSPACRRELLFLSELRGAVEIASRDRLEASEERLGRLMERIDRWESAREGTERAPGDRDRRPRWAWIAAAAVVLALAASAFWWAGPERTAETTFRTLSRGGAQDGTLAAAPAPASPLRVIFEDGVSEAELRALLLEVNAEIVAGPSPLGVYTVAPSEPPSRSSEGGTGLLRRLREDPRIALVEQARGAP